MRGVDAQSVIKQHVMRTSLSKDAHGATPSFDLPCRRLPQTPPQTHKKTETQTNPQPQPH
jgi:hypothetical protein